ncbi:MAG: hypothetical protein AB1467_07245 [Candidatus Diapherotrites archaeon]
MVKKQNQEAFSQMYLARALESEVQAWVDQGWHGVTQTTLELFNYWFSRDEDIPSSFIPVSAGQLRQWFIAMRFFRLRHCNSYLKR